jgi:drug/metabolite transporter (DMT)-like permease
LTALVLALGASLAWGVADFAGPLIARTLGALRVLFWAQVGGLAAIGIAVAVRGEGPHDWLVLLAMPAALAGTLGLWAFYRGVAAGAISVVAPIAGASAVIPVVFGIATGDSPSAAQIGGIGCALLGVVLASLEPQEGSRRVAAGAGLALLAAIGFGCYFPPMHVAGKADFWWASLVFRTASLLVISLAVAVQKPSLRVGRRELAIVLGVGIGDTVGNVLFAASSGHGLVSLTAVLASLYPIVTVLLAATVLSERTAPAQRAGIALTLAGVVLIAI